MVVKIKGVIRVVLDSLETVDLILVIMVVTDKHVCRHCSPFVRFVHEAFDPFAGRLGVVRPQSKTVVFKLWLSKASWVKADSFMVRASWVSFPFCLRVAVIWSLLADGVKANFAAWFLRRCHEFANGVEECLDSF